MTDGRPAILVEGLRKSYGETHALDGLDLRVEEGTVLGPNGAGKTTAVRVLEPHAKGGARGEGGVSVDAVNRRAGATVEGGARLLAAVVRDLDRAGSG